MARRKDLWNGYVLSDEMKELGSYMDDDLELPE